MKRSVSSVLAERMKARKAVTPRKLNVRYVKFTPEEMAIDAGDIDASEGPIIARGSKEWEAFLSFKRGYVRLEPELRKVFKDDRAVNELLRQFVEIAKKANTAKRRKSA